MQPILKFNEYITEGFDQKFRGFPSIGDFVKNHISDEYVLSMVNFYISDIDHTVNISSAVNTLDQITLDYLYKKICAYLDGNESEVPEDVNESTIVAGKNIFKSFLRMLSALGLKENKPDWENTPSDFLIYYQFDSLKFDDVKAMMSRFKSLVPFIERLEQNDAQKLYFGINENMEFEYGILVEEHNYIGKFKMNKSNFNWLITQDTSASSSLKRELVDLSIDKMTLFSRIKKDMKNFIPGKYKSKTVPVITNDIITFSYHGIGRWADGEIDQTDLETLKSNFKTWAAKFKWSYKSKINVSPNDFWVKYQIKLTV